MRKIYVVDVKSQKQPDRSGYKGKYRYVFETDHEKLNKKNVTRQKIYTVFSNMFEFNNQSFRTIDEYKCHTILTK